MCKDLGWVANSTSSSHHPCLAFSPEQLLLEGVACWAPGSQKQQFALPPYSRIQWTRPLPTALSYSSKVSSHQSPRMAEGYLLEGLGCLLCLAGWLGPRRLIPPPEDSQFILHVLSSAGQKQRRGLISLPHTTPANLGHKRPVGWSEGHLLLHGVPPL